MSVYPVFLLSIILTALSTFSLLAKSEGIRGMGRIFDGLARISFGGFFLMLVFSTQQLPPLFAWPSYLLIAFGLVTIGAGARKFARRNLAG
ncbi:MAG: hypothetical protein KGS72_22535 [Cyanobacteria bacterium REEB67]|nr:hypothetical protein [Cyanobacteria bacterium REEB67]